MKEQQIVQCLMLDVISSAMMTCAAWAQKRKKKKLTPTLRTAQSFVIAAKLVDTMSVFVCDSR